MSALWGFVCICACDELIIGRTKESMMIYLMARKLLIIGITSAAFYYASIKATRIISTLSMKKLLTLLPAPNIQGVLQRILMDLYESA
jgi:hypothetical protein